MVELLKQKEHYPIHYAKQAVMLYAGINGYLDKVPLHAIRSFEQDVYTRLDSSAGELFGLITREKKLTDEVLQ